jgi:hypothetical protein
MEYQRDEHRVHLILDHLVWTRTRRKAVLKDAIAVDGRRLMEQTCAEQGWEIVEPASTPIISIGSCAFGRAWRLPTW